MSNQSKIPAQISEPYKYGFSTDVEQNVFPAGLNLDIIKNISDKRNDPKWVQNWRKKAFKYWQKMEEPHWADFDYKAIQYQKYSYYAEVKKKELNNLDEVDPEILRTFEKLGIPLQEQKLLSGVAVDAVFDSISVTTTHKEKLAKMGIIFCSISEAIQKYPEMVKKYLGSVVPINDNFFACLNSAVFSDGTFVYIPKKVRCPIELSSYFRMNAENTGQFERTLIIADEDSYVSYLEGCSAPEKKENQLHSAVVEIVALENAEIKYSTVQNWFPGTKDGVGGVYNFVTKRGLCKGKHSKISWTQLETGSAKTWKYPSCILAGDNSVGEFFSIAVTNNKQQTDTGTKMIHLGKNTKSTIISKSIAVGQSTNTYRGLVEIGKNATGSKNFSSCDSLLFGDECSTNTFPKLKVKNNKSEVKHEATTSKVDENILFYLRQRGLNEEEASKLIVTGFSKEIIKKLPMEFAMEAVKLLEISFEGSVG